MKCPLLRAGFYANPNIDISVNADCLKEECAWWDEKRLCCEYRSTRIELSRLVERLDAIVKKMPYPPAPKNKGG